MPGSLSPAHRSHSSYDEALASRRIVMGRHSYGRPRVHVYPGDTFQVRIGAYCSIGEDVEFLPGGHHPTMSVTTFPFSYRTPEFSPTQPGRVRHAVGDVEVGSDVWIGRGARILSNVAIGHGAVVGAYAVVAASVRPYAVVVGNPATEAYRRFEDSLVDSLLQGRWWELDDESVGELVESFPDPLAFARAVEALRAGRNWH